MELRTQRLVLRPWTEDDVDVLLEIRNRPDVVNTSATPEARPREQMVWRVGRRGRILARARARLVADIELGVVIHPDHWGRGFAGEAGLAVAADCFDRVGLERVYAGVDPANAKSLRVIAKTPGFKQIDSELYELTAAVFASRLE